MTEPEYDDGWHFYKAQMVCHLFCDVGLVRIASLYIVTIEYWSLLSLIFVLWANQAYRGRLSFGSSRYTLLIKLFFSTFFPWSQWLIFSSRLELFFNFHIASSSKFFIHIHLERDVKYRYCYIYSQVCLLRAYYI